MIQAVRRFFILQDYLEVETPLLIPAPAPEVHIDAMDCGSRFLQTSPELCMKMLLAEGFPRIFQICRCFRAQERGDRHLPEFTMLEWYRAGASYQELMRECESLLAHVSRELQCGPTISYRGCTVKLQPPWEMITVADAFFRHAPLQMPEALRTNCFDEMMAVHIEPALGRAAPTFLYDYPLHHGSLAQAKTDDNTLAERFELYIGGLELANGCSELTDGEEQRRRFQIAEQERRKSGKKAYPSAERFLAALPLMPRAAGVALGIDRLVMILTDAATIEDVVSFRPEDL